MIEVEKIKELLNNCNSYSLEFQDNNITTIIKKEEINKENKIGF